MAKNTNLKWAQQQRANLARAYASSSAPQKSASELMEERLLPLRERQQQMQMEEYLGGANLRSQQRDLAQSETQQAMSLLPISGRRQRMEAGEFFESAGLRAQQRNLALAQTGQALGMLPLQRRQQETEIGEYLSGAGLRAQQQALAGRQAALGQAETDIGLARIGDVGAAGRRAYTFGREEEELNRLRMAAEGRKLQGQMSFQPQMEAIRGGIMGRMASRLGVSLPAMGGTYSSGTGYTPSWMQGFQSPQFPRY